MIFKFSCTHAVRGGKKESLQTSSAFILVTLLSLFAVPLAVIFYL